ncbi:uncharacterized protein B0H18DRAFT_958624 [Fomitopsis serialis]|uniref:uncharacterized protein n=1 Tax=Fomitopsis serialis TaxID=139415 RepID=UPI0020084857|nr:uncharacterized protein B0H18DRAFT_958624 [Neoantrodia serialis]KAH9916883.1 hypothetical protein B0H18DRAFT_958624 [Neoantrodia serialis]
MEPTSSAEQELKEFTWWRVHMDAGQRSVESISNEAGERVEQYMRSADFERKLSLDGVGLLEKAAAEAGGQLKGVAEQAKEGATEGVQKTRSGCGRTMRGSDSERISCEAGARVEEYLHSADFERSLSLDGLRLDDE